MLVELLFVVMVSSNQLTFVLTFNSPNIPTVVKIGFTDRVKVVLLLWINCVIVRGYRDSRSKLMQIYDDL